jgi:predicted NBD/HSP70 family sugar kinase
MTPSEEIKKPENIQPGLFVGLDIGGTKTAVLVVDRAMNVLGRGIAPTLVNSPGELVDGIFDAVLDTLDRCGADAADLLAVGAGVPGMVDPETGIVQLAVNLNLEAYPLGPVLSERFGVPIALENDVRAASLGAYRWLNDLSPVRHMAYLSIGTGIAAGLVLDGHLYRGSQGMAGEIGHVTFEPRGPLCRCGMQGCLEAVAAGPSIAYQWRSGQGTAEHVFSAAKQGDPAARQVISRAAEGVAWAIQLLVMAYDVERVVLGGGVMNAGDAFLELIQEHLAVKREMSGLARRMLPPQKVLAAPSEADVARWGAVLLALEAFEESAPRSQPGAPIQIGVKRNA